MLLCTNLLYSFPLKIKFSYPRKQYKYGFNYIKTQSYSEIKDNRVRCVSFSKVKRLSFAVSNKRNGRAMSCCF
jgi:hypothetical protein